MAETSMGPLFTSITKKLKDNSPALTLLLVGFLGGVLWLGALKFWLVHPQETHFHSNFAVYVDGVREEFKSFTYYEEIAACTADFASNPKGRAHMHDNVNDVIHVHDQAVTYADFFANIGWTLGPDFVRTDKGLILNTAEKKWEFILNGKAVDRVDTTVIGDQDKLLVSYGPVRTNFFGQYEKIENKAKTVDSQQDPASCGGLNGPGNNTLAARLKRAFLFSE